MREKGYGHKYANNTAYLRDSPALNLSPYARSGIQSFLVHIRDIS